MYPKDALCQFYVILPNGPWEESFKNTKPYFHSFLVLSFWMGTDPSFELKTPSPKHTLCPDRLNWICGFGEKRFWFISSSYLHSFLIIFPVKGKWPFFLTNWKALLQNILKRAQSGWNWRPGSLFFLKYQTPIVNPF